MENNILFNGIGNRKHTSIGNFFVICIFTSTFTVSITQFFKFCEYVSRKRRDFYVEKDEEKN